MMKYSLILSDSQYKEIKMGPFKCHPCNLEFDDSSKLMHHIISINHGIEKKSRGEAVDLKVRKRDKLDPIVLRQEMKRNRSDPILFNEQERDVKYSALTCDDPCKGCFEFHLYI